MKFLCERDALNDALSCVARRTKGGNTVAIPILSHILIEAEGQSIKLTGHNLDSCSQATIAAEVETPGAICISADRFSKLINGAPKGSQVVVDADEKVASVKCGRSNYKFGIMPASGFPSVITPKDPVKFTLSAEHIARLFETPAPCVCTTSSTIYLAGIYLHQIGKKLVAAATDRHTLIEARVRMDTPAFDPVLVPEDSCTEFARIAADGEAQIEIARNAIAVEANGRRFISKLIDAEFPKDYVRAIPTPSVPCFTVDLEGFDAALARLVTACDPDKKPIITLAWEEKADGFTASLRTDFGQGNEQVECDCSQERKAGRVGVQNDYLRKLLGALGGKTSRIYIAGPNDAIRIENPSEPDLVAVIMPVDLR